MGWAGRLTKGLKYATGLPPTPDVSVHSEPNDANNPFKTYKTRGFLSN